MVRKITLEAIEIEPYIIHSMGQNIACQGNDVYLVYQWEDVFRGQELG